MTQVVVAHSYQEARFWAGPGEPFRAPHHTVSTAGMLGGMPRQGTLGPARVHPGEATLATGGVLYLGEIHEWRRSTLLDLAQAIRAGRDFIHGYPTAPRILALGDATAVCQERWERHGLPSDLAYLEHVKAYTHRNISTVRGVLS